MDKGHTTMKVERIKLFIPGSDLRDYAVGDRMDCLDQTGGSTSRKIKVMELTPTGGVLIEFSGGFLNLFQDIPMIVSLSQRNDNVTK